MTQISIRVNGTLREGECEPRTSLADFLRDKLRLTGTHLGCEQGVCGACTVMVDGKPMRSCITFAVSANGKTIETIEGYSDDPLMAIIRRKFSECHALQCGFCTPGMLATAYDIVKRNACESRGRIRRELSGNLCRCTGYEGIVRAIEASAKEWQASQTSTDGDL